jgi:hypothetical protein
MEADDAGCGRSGGHGQMAKIRHGQAVPLPRIRPGRMRKLLKGNQ